MSDSRLDTLLHIRRVQQLLDEVIVDLTRRRAGHDASKLESPEVEGFDEWSPKLAGVEYDSEGYRDALRAMGPFLAYHYGANDHHPEHYPNGIADMGLVAMIEMLADWKAAGERTARGDLAVSIGRNIVRFGFGPEIAALLMNTAAELGWL